MPKSILVHLNSAPFGNSNTKEALDLVLAAGTFEQDIAFLLSGDACFLLLEQQDPKHIDQKNIRQMMKALSLYGVETLYFDQSDAVERNIPLNACTLATDALSKQQIRDKVRNSDIVIRF